MRIGRMTGLFDWREVKRNEGALVPISRSGMLFTFDIDLEVAPFSWQELIICFASVLSTPVFD